MYFFKTALTILFLALSSKFFSQQNAFDFDGIDDYATAPNASALITNSGQLSMTMWVYPTSTVTGYPNFEGFAGFRNDLNADFYLLQLGTNTVEARFRNSGGTNFDIVYNGLVLNAWNHFVLTYDGTNFSLYHNGIFQASIAANGTITNSTQGFNIGRLPFSTSFFLDGKLDEVSLWNTSLAQGDVTAIYNGCGIDPNSAGLQLLYGFNQGIANGNNSGIVNLLDATGTINASITGAALSGSSSNFVNGVQGGGFSTSSTSSCETYTWALNGVTYASSGTYTYVIPNGSSNGCDSTVYLNLTISSPPDLTTNVTSCDSYTWSVNGSTYTTSTTAMATLTNSLGCSYNHTLNLTIKNSTEATDVEVSCDSYTWIDGNTYTSSTNTPTIVIPNSVGCDSIITLDLTINSISNTVINNGDGSYSSDVAAIEYSWVDCANSYTALNGENGQTFIPTLNGTYALIVSDANCTDTSGCFNVGGIGINEITERFKIYPIPSTDKLEIIPFQKGEFTYRIFDALGKEIQNETKLQKIICIENLAEGYFYLEISNEDGFIQNYKFIKH